MTAKKIKSLEKKYYKILAKFCFANFSSTIFKNGQDRKFGKVCFPLTEHQSNRLFLNKTFQILIPLLPETRMSRPDVNRQKFAQQRQNMLEIF